MPAAHASVKLVQRADKVRADGTAPVYVRVIANRKPRFISTGVYVAPKDWNAERQLVRSGHEIAPALNAKILKLRNEAQTAALDTPTADAVKATMSGSAGTLTAYFERFIEGLDAKGAFWEWKKYRVTLGKVRKCLGAEVAWKEVDRAALVRFERSLVKAGNAPNTVRKELTRLHRVYKEALRDGVIKPSEDPFLVYRQPKGQKVNRRKLTLDEVEKLAALGEAKGLAPGSFDEAARDAFVFAFYAGGMRFSDVVQLKAADVKGTRAEYRMMKTSTLMSVPLPPPAVEIAAQYVASADARGGYLFPLLKQGDDRDGVHLRKRIASKNTQANGALKRLADMAEIDRDGLSTHVARHSFADYARRESGDLYAISKALGHGNLSTTETYLRSFDQDAVDKLATDLWT